MAEANRPARGRAWAGWGPWLGLGLALRVAAALAVSWWVARLGKLCVFGDTTIYVALGRAIAEGRAFEVSQWGVPHYALRTPGYPIFLAGCRLAFGPGLVPVRLVQAALGVLAAWMLGRLVAGLDPAARRDRPGWSTAATAAVALAALEPYVAGMSALVLSEAVFLPLMMAGLWGLAVLWRPAGDGGSGRSPFLVAAGTGLAMGAAILARPSWALFVPLILMVWVAAAGRGGRRRAIRGAVVVAMTTALVMAPWWARNARATGRFVPTALWVGASLLDGVGPQADGSSDMRFVEAPDVRALGEVEQDRVFRDRAVTFAREHPRRVVELAWIKLGRFWSPWPNAETLRNPWAAAASAAVTLPVFGLIALGACARRRDARALALLLGPLLYFCALHLVFVSSIRYRIPGLVPALGLAGFGWAALRGRGGGHLEGEMPLAGLPVADGGGIGAAQGGGRAMKRRWRLRKLILWSLAITAAAVAGAAAAAYYYVTEGETLAELVRREAPRYLPGGRVDLIRARLRPFAGEVQFHSISVGDGGPGGPAGVAQVPSLKVHYDPWAMLHGRFEPTGVVVARPTIRLRRRDDGTWNVRGLLADPWPGPRGGSIPPIRVEQGTVELIGAGGGALRVLTDVTVAIPAVAAGEPVPFELSAKGDLFERVEAKGVVDPESGRVELAEGELVRLNLSDSLWDRLPPEVNAVVDQVGLSAGEVDARWARLTLDPADPAAVLCEGVARLRRGIWNCPNLPFPISDVAVDVEVRGRTVAITSASGSDGTTTLAVRGHFALDDPARAPFEVAAEATGLQLDGRLRAKTPPKFRDLWDAYFPEVARSRAASAGRINLALHVGRPAEGAPVDVAADVDLVDVAMQYKHFPYRVEHVQGRMHVTPKRLTLRDLRTVVGNRPLVVNGTVDDPGPDAIARLKFEAEALPVDDPRFLQALPKDVGKVVNEFKPTGTVQGVAHLLRVPDPSRRDPIGKVEFRAEIDLNDNCSATWKGLPYPVRNLKGHLGIAPDRWTFRGMRGSNGQATIQVDGEVHKVGRDPAGRDLLDVDVKVGARNLPFDHPLRDALPTPWQLTWKTLNPTGASDIDATVELRPGRPEHYHVLIRPRPQTGVTLRFSPVGPTGAMAAQPLELRMDDVGGDFVFDTLAQPPTSMAGVSFTFQRAPVTFAQGTVDVKDTGAFNLGVSRLVVRDLLLDEGLRRMMPPVMAAFARRLDDRKIQWLGADLGLGWSGQVGESAWCQWRHGLAVLTDNRLDIGGRDIALEHVNGQLGNLQGKVDGAGLALRGDVELASVSLLGQQMTRVAGSIAVADGVAAVALDRGTILGGTAAGHVSSTLDATPRYSVEVRLDNAELQEYARTLPGHQTFKGRVSGQAKVDGLGYDLHSLNGSGWARVVDGDLGTLPPLLRVGNLLKDSGNKKTAFDSAEVTARISHGETALKPVRLIGNTLSLDGGGALDVRGILNLKLEVVPGRDTGRFPLVGDSIRELGGLLGAVRVEGPIGAPSTRLEAVPLVGDSLKTPGRLLRAARPPRDAPATPPAP